MRPVIPGKIIKSADNEIEHTEVQNFNNYTRYITVVYTVNLYGVVSFKNWNIVDTPKSKT